MKDNIISLFGILLPGGFTIASLIEKLNPVLQFIGLIITIVVGITVCILNITKRKKIKQDIKIDNIILKHKDEIKLNK